MEKMMKILEDTYRVPELRRRTVPLFMSNPGLGKTTLVQDFAQSKKARLVEIIASTVSPLEITGISMPNKEGTKMTYLNYDTLTDLKDGDIVFFDEILNGSPVVLNACLTFLEQRKMISGDKLPDIMIVAAANPQGAAVLHPQVKERFVWYNMEFSSEMWGKFMFNKFGLPQNIISSLASLIYKEDFKGVNNFHTGRSIDKATVAFIHRAESPYKIVEELLNNNITNILKDPITLSKGLELLPGEKMSWLKMKQYEIDQKQQI